MEKCLRTTHMVVIRALVRLRHGVLSGRQPDQLPRGDETGEASMVEACTAGFSDGEAACPGREACDDGLGGGDGHVPSMRFVHRDQHPAQAPLWTVAFDSEGVEEAGVRNVGGHDRAGNADAMRGQAPVGGGGP